MSDDEFIREQIEHFFSLGVRIIFGQDHNGVHCSAVDREDYLLLHVVTNANDRRDALEKIVAKYTTKKLLGEPYGYFDG